jgi:hypothetical protein
VKRLSITLARAGALCCALVLAAVDAAAQNPAAASATSPRPAATNELDVFMQKVLARREVNRKTLEQYILDETSSDLAAGRSIAPSATTPGTCATGCTSGARCDSMA